jgi:hypothetical protein
MASPAAVSGRKDIWLESGDQALLGRSYLRSGQFGKKIMPLVDIRKLFAQGPEKHFDHKASNTQNTRFTFVPGGDGVHRIPFVLYTGLQTIFSHFLTNHIGYMAGKPQRDDDKSFSSKAPYEVLPDSAVVAEDDINDNVAADGRNTYEGRQWDLPHDEVAVEKSPFSRVRDMNLIDIFSQPVSVLLQPYELILSLLATRGTTEGSIRLDSDKIVKIWSHTRVRNKIVHKLRKNLDPVTRNETVYVNRHWPQLLKQINDCTLGGGVASEDIKRCVSRVAQNTFLTWIKTPDMSLMDNHTLQLDNFISQDSWPSWSRFILTTLGRGGPIPDCTSQIVYTERDISTLGSLRNMVMWPYFVWFLRHQLTHWVSCCGNLDIASRVLLGKFLHESIRYLPCSFCSVHAMSNGVYNKAKLLYEAVCMSDPSALETLEWSLHNQVNQSLRMSNTSSFHERYMTFSDYKSTVVKNLICFNRK